MDKNAIRKFAVWARRELIARVSQRAERFGITEKTPGDPNAESVNGHLLTDTERRQRAALIARIRKHGYKAVMEEAAYTWFNRFCALRFMEVNGFLPTRIRVFTDEENGFHPQILAEAIHMELTGLDMERVYQLKSDSDDEALYKYLLITQCNALCDILPGMFTPIADYTGLLLPDNLLREGSVIEQMIALIPEADWLDQVQIIGWLYQYYNAEPKDEVFANLKKNIKISKRDIPAATQLFTPDWIVRYMVENSLGRLWVEGHPDEALKASWTYYLEEAEQEPQVQKELARIRAEYAQMKPEDIRCIDPCMGSGHILVYMFDVLLQIYQAYGYSTREAVQSILQNNLYGLDIDDRAAQLAYFAVMMKARQVDRRFFSRGIQPHVRAIAESEYMPQEAWALFGPQQDIARRVYAAFVDAKEYGSLIEPNVTLEELDALDARMAEMDEMADYGNLTVQARTLDAIGVIAPLAQQAQVLLQKYDVVVTNPPYMGSSGMNTRLSDFVKRAYPDSKSDLFAVFIEKCIELSKENRYQALITQHAWMSLASYEKLRIKLYKNCIVNMIHLGAKAFEEVSGEMVQTTSFVLQNCNISERIGCYCRLIDANNPHDKELMFLRKDNRHFVQQERFRKIPGAPVSAYVAGNTLARIYDEGQTINNIGEVRIGMGTGDNDRFLRLWWEIEQNQIDFSISDVSELDRLTRRYVPYSKGGERKRWYGNHEYVVWYDKEGRQAMSHTSGHRENGGYEVYFHKGMTWSYSTMAPFCARIMPEGFVFDVNGSSVFMPPEYYSFTIALLQSCVGRLIIDSTKSAFSIQAGTIRNIPIIGSSNDSIERATDLCIQESRNDWDAFETSWDFQQHPFIRWASNLRDATSIGCLMKRYYGNTPEVSCPLELCFLLWQGECNERFAKLKANEEELNRIFIDIYGLQDELTPEVEDKDVTVRRADLGRDIRSFISYAVGCMFGRYSLCVPGLLYAGGNWDYEAIQHQIWDGFGKNFSPHDPVGTLDDLLPDRDGILPITDDEYFDDDIVGRFVQFVETVFGRDSLEKNLRFIANALGGNGTPRQVIRSYFLNDFYADHLKIYQKRPIYWLFDSGKKNGFKCLIYMHRYAPDTIARIRTDYVHEQQSRYRTAIADLEKRVASASTAERVKLQKQLTKVAAQADELRAYEEKIHHLADQMIAIDLDDGVKVNYAKFDAVLAKIK